jgi:hypothetical protein
MSIFDVRGVQFAVGADLLQKVSETPLLPLIRDANTSFIHHTRGGAIELDRDPLCFALILQWFSSEEEESRRALLACLSRDMAERLYTEADFFLLSGLKLLLRQRFPLLLCFLKTEGFYLCKGHQCAFVFHEDGRFTIRGALYTPKGCIKEAMPLRSYSVQSENKVELCCKGKEGGQENTLKFYIHKLEYGTVLEMPGFACSLQYLGADSCRDATISSLLNLQPGPDALQ